LKNLKKIEYLSLCCFLFLAFFTVDAVGQDRQRVIRTVSSQPINQPPARSATESTTRPSTTSTTRTTTSSRPTLTNELTVAPPPPLVKKTSMTASMARRSLYSNAVSSTIMDAIENRLGIPYLYGSEGPNRYDCSGFVWAVFKDAGIEFERTSARSLWAMSEPVTGDERYRFGTLVFMNKLGHMGIVADEKGFYHASTSKGVTYSTFEGYWENRIVGFRRLTLLPRTEAADLAR
jgi:cell wall-associated NlpC family hydrolase